MEVRQISRAGVIGVVDDGVEQAAALASTLDPGVEEVVWIHCEHTDERGMELLREYIRPAPEDEAECHNRTPVPMIRVYPGHLFSAINGLARGTDKRLHFQPLKAFMNHGLLITVLGPCHESLPRAAAERQISRYRDRMDAAGAAPTSTLGVLSSIRFDLLRSQEELMRAAAGQIAQMELDVLECDPVRSEAMLNDLFAIRHDVQTIRTNAAQTFEVFDHMLEQLEAQPDLIRVDTRRIAELRHGFGHLRNTADLEREYLQELLDLFQTRVSTELNRFVRQVTAWGSIAIGWTVIAGIYGMNFTHMPELSWHYGYPLALALMLFVGGSLAWLFHRRGWL